MCLDCGCNKVNDSHNDPRHITLDDLVQAGKASGISTAQAFANIIKTLKQMAEHDHETDGESS